VATGAVAELHAWETGAGDPAVLCLHETGATGEVFRRLADALAPTTRVIAFDRPGWGRSPAPEAYVRTTVGEQATVAATVLAERGGTPAVVCGAGIGAVAALELSIRRPEVVAGTVLVEPPLLAFVPEATDALSGAADLVREAVAEGGRELTLERFATGGLGVLSAGAERVPEAARDGSAAAAQTLFAELAAVPAWEVPLSELAVAPRPSVIVVGADTQALVRAAAAGLERALARTELREVGPGLPHHDQAPELAALVVEVADAAGG
jgi:pimeloyl-ACP methyl ester carboxylesterase